MSKESKRVAPRLLGSDTTKTHILSALAYLTSVCEIAECRNILLTSLDLCVWCSAYEENGLTELAEFSPPCRQDGLVAALNFLCGEANRNNMGDFENIIEAACTLISYFLIHHRKMEPSPLMPAH